tara:strand:- start:4352 stop:5059 length:708 start_codon:yes stop_codon:yes gene_type:complete
MSLKIICIVCARGGSKGIKNKNLQLVDRKPLIYYPIKAAQKSGVVDKLIVSTDSKKIALVAKKFGAEVPFIRPKKYSGDLTTTEDTLKFSINMYEKITNKKFDICVFLTATDIFRKISWIQKAVNILKHDNKLESVFCGHKTHKNFWELKNNKWNRIRPWMKNYSSRQIRRYVVREDTGIACASRAELWRKGKRIGNKVKIIENSVPFTNIDIHEIDDLKLANYAMKLWKKNLYR